MVDQQIGVVAGFKLTMFGDLVVRDLVTIKGSVDFRIELGGANPAIELIVNGKLALAPLGDVTITNSGFRIDASGLVARVEVELKVETAFQGFGLGGGVSVVLAVNTSGSTVVLGSSAVDPGFLVRISGGIDLKAVSGTGSVEIRVGPGGLELKFDIGFSIGGISFGAKGGAGVYADGFALLLSVHAGGGGDIFEIQADGTIAINTTGSARLGIAANTFTLDVTGKLSVLKVFTMDARLTFTVSKGFWQLKAARPDELLRPGHP